MSFPRFLIGMLSVLVVFALTTYSMTGSIVSTLLQTLVCAVLIQLGYFLVVLVLVARSERVPATKKQHRYQERNGADGLVAKIRHITNLLRSRHS